MWGITGIQKEAVLSARKSIVTVEEVVDEFEPRPFEAVLPSVALDAVSIVPNGAYPSYAHDYYSRDNAFYEAWDPVGRDREAFREWMEKHVFGAEDFAGHLQSIEADGMVRG